MSSTDKKNCAIDYLQRMIWQTTGRRKAALMFIKLRPLPLRGWLMEEFEKLEAGQKAA
jgi:hypothetical protein